MAAAPIPRSFSPPTGFRGSFRTDLAARALYAECAGIARAVPEAIAVPRDAADIAALVEWAAANEIALIPRGSGSGMAGGALGGDVIVDCSRIDWIDEVDRERRTVRCGPGAIRSRVDAAARTHGLRFPVDPSSGAFCTMGGMAAANAAGARTLRFGPTRAWIEALDGVLADGSAEHLRRGTVPMPGSRLASITTDRLPRWRNRPELRHEVRKESSGYQLAAAADSGDVIDLLAGSEGTLAIFTALEFRLAPVANATASALAAFRSLDDATVAAVNAQELGASACELLDRTFLEIAAASSSLSVATGSDAVLLIEAEGASSREARSIITTIADACRRAGSTQVELALDTPTETALWELRHAASPTLARLDPSLKSMQFIEDACVPSTALPAYVRGVRAALTSRNIRGVIFGHAGDAHVHVNPLIDVRRPGWRSDVAAVLDEVTALVATLGGTLAGEHGDGRLRSALLDRVWSADALQEFVAVKHALDPRGILNPGVKIARNGDAPLGDIKYDPDLPPLPATARAALDRIERDRAYATFRLSFADAS